MQLPKGYTKEGHQKYSNKLTIITVSLAILFMTSKFWPTFDLFAHHAHYLPFHQAMEFFSIIVASLVFAIGWNTFNATRPLNFIILSIGFLCVGLVDFFHTLSYPGMSDFLGENSIQKSLIFWLSARLIAAISLFAIAFLPWKTVKYANIKYYALSVALILVSTILILGVSYQEILPLFFTQSEGLTPAKINLEYFIVFLHFATAVLLWKKKEQIGINFIWLAYAVAIMGLGELFFTLYSEMNDLYNVAGHIYKVIAYVMVYKAVFVASVENPYTELRRASLEKLRLMQYAVDHSGDLVYWISPSGHIVSANGSVYRRLGYSDDELSGTHFGKLETTLLPKQWDLFRNRLRVEEKIIQEGVHFTKSGDEFPSEIRTTYFTHEGQEYICAFVRDISGRKLSDEALHASEKRLNEAQRIAHIGSWELDLLSNALLWSNEIFNIFEIDQKRFSPSYESFLDAIHPEDRDLVNESYQHSVENKTSYEITHRLLMPDGRIKFVEERGETFYNEAGEPVKSFGTVQDITKETELQDQAFHDPLTGVYNRRFLDVSLERELQRAARNNTNLCFIICDLDHFKQVNDTYGHDFGDHVLKKVASYLSQKLRGEDFVCRFGGEEFIIVLPDTAIEDISERMADIRIGISELVFNLPNKSKTHITISAGIASYPEHAANAKELFKVADKALYAAKIEGRNRFETYTNDN